LAWEATFLDKIVMILGLQLKDVVNVTSTWIVFKQSNKVAYMRQAQNNEFVLNFFELMVLENLPIVVITIIEQMFNKGGFISAQRDGKYFGNGCSVDLFFYQLFTFIHNLSTPIIYNRMKM
jgi:hypothetical protein